MTNTERLIETLRASIAGGQDSVRFYTGRYTGNGASVVNALRRRGYTVTRKIEGYELRQRTVDSSAIPTV